mmetsp:Transcript_53480/g.91989  ORF Transcript_53480/g.91989 Transcript_53480/m.91989 type:complete len:203 (-) Transcript_53480:218-826(-)
MQVPVVVQSSLRVLVNFPLYLRCRSCFRLGKVDRFLSAEPSAISMEILSSQAATLGGWCRAHADAVEDNGPRCVKALEWCATASEMHSQQQQRRQQGTPASPASPASLPSASPPPVPPPLTELPKTKDGDGHFMAAEVVLSLEAAARCASLRDALMGHRHVLTRDITPRYEVLQEVFLGAIKAQRETEKHQSGEVVHASPQK